MSTVIVNNEAIRVIRDAPAARVVREAVAATRILAVAEQGPPGPPGIDGNVAGGALLAVNKLGEFASSTTDQLAAQQNLGLGVIDPLAYYILAKA